RARITASRKRNSGEASPSAGRPQRGAEAGDDRSAERDRGERVQEACLEESPAQPRERQQLEGDDDDGGYERGAVLRDQERQRVEDPAEEGAEAGDRAAQVRVAAPGQVASVREALGEGHAHAGAERRGQPRDKG